MGKIVKVSGPLVVASGLSEANMADVVRVGEQHLIGEILTMSGDSGAFQVYEETSGLGPGAEVVTTGAPLSVELGPGLIENIYDGIQRPLEVNRQKTGVESNIRLLDLPRRIIEKYRGLCEDGRIFPVPHYMTCLYGIRAVAKRCGITKHLTWHQSRHTAATTVFLSNGVPIETVSSMLGHKSIKTTQIYAKITKEKLNQDMENLVARLGSIEEFKGCNI